MASSYKVIREENGKIIKGTAFSAFINNGVYFVTDIIVFEDAMIECWGLVDLPEFKEKVKQGWVVTKLPNGANVSVGMAASFTAKEVTNTLDPADFVKEIEDEIKRLNGQKTSSVVCKEIYRQFAATPTEALRLALNEAYQTVPKHLRRFLLGDMDVKDIPIRMILEGDQAQEDWSHRQVAKKRGIKPLPSIQVPKTKNK